MSGRLLGIRFLSTTDPRDGWIPVWYSFPFTSHLEHRSGERKKRIKVCPSGSGFLSLESLTSNLMKRPAISVSWAIPESIFLKTWNRMPVLFTSFPFICWREQIWNAYKRLIVPVFLQEIEPENCREYQKHKDSGQFSYLLETLDIEENRKQTSGC